MRKLTLELDQLQVDTFTTSAAGTDRRTVFANDDQTEEQLDPYCSNSADGTCMTCATCVGQPTCDGTEGTCVVGCTAYATCYTCEPC